MLRFNFKLGKPAGKRPFEGNLNDFDSNKIRALNPD